jgi:predicted DsbA family dithiol-disulfide isomerase
VKKVHLSLNFAQNDDEEVVLVSDSVCPVCYAGEAMCV